MIIKTKNNNNYYFSFLRREILLLPTVLSDIVENKGLYSNNIESDFDNKERDYYKRKYELLKDSGYFDDVSFHAVRSERYTEDMFEYAICNSSHLVLETTEACNLDCVYCGYGRFYKTFGKRTNMNLNFDKVKIILDFLSEKWNSVNNVAFNRKIVISFYGGEPLVNFDLIQKTVLYANSLRLRKNYIKYYITTNATIIEKYIDFLVKWDFKVLISLDGNSENNAYRIYKDGRESFSKIYDNLLMIREKYPYYFRDNIEFNSVFHNKSSFANVSNFFKNEFEKIPQFLMLNTVGVKKEMKEKFAGIYKDPKSSNTKKIDVESSMTEKLSPLINNAFLLIQYYTNFHYEDYNSLRFDLKSKQMPTGTCIPFLKKVYLSPQGFILPCEKIDPKYKVGSVLDEKVVINYSAIVNYYNRLFDRMESVCAECSNVFCKSCIFLMEEDEYGTRKCEQFNTQSDFENLVKSYVDELENHPSIMNYFVEKLYTY